MTFRLTSLACLIYAVTASASELWLDLMPASDPLAAWRTKPQEWVHAGDAKIEGKKLVAVPGSGVLVNSPAGRAADLYTKQNFGDVAVRLDFMIGPGSNAGVKLMGLYEIQILDSANRKELTGNMAGGIYPRAEEWPRYHHIDQGIAPKVNAARPAGEWQSLDIEFHAPRFDSAGNKTANAKFVKVLLNGQLIHENQELLWPTGGNWRLRKEVPNGPLMLQGDHGPCAFRYVRIRPLMP